MPSRGQRLVLLSTPPKVVPQHVSNSPGRVHVLKPRRKRKRVLLPESPQSTSSLVEDSALRCSPSKTEEFDLLLDVILTRKLKRQPKGKTISTASPNRRRRKQARRLSNSPPGGRLTKPKRKPTAQEVLKSQYNENCTIASDVLARRDAVKACRHKKCRGTIQSAHLSPDVLWSLILLP